MRSTFIVGAIIALTASAQAEQFPQASREDPRVRFVDYHPAQVVLVAGQLLTSTQIEFAADEKIVVVGVGNPSWHSVAKDNLLFLKPTERHPTTNLNVVTVRGNGEKRSYQLMLGVLPAHVAHVAKEPPFYLVKFRYPTDEQLRRQQADAARSADEKARHVDRVLARDEVQGVRNYAYSIQGEAAFEPIEVYDNGKITTLRFNGNIEMPAIYLGLKGGKEELIPKNVNGNSVMIHTVARKLILRRGDEVMCVFNEAYSAVGVDPGTKTTSPSVARVTKAPTEKPASTQTVTSAPAVTVLPAQAPHRPTK